ncbi:TRAP transporter small permease subunit [Ferrovibrio sp.]|uniref:TRAP transporter small permease subunit n=1 Tax=Ferrovibrio sp. TaxID=1917215 RepID=UPI00262F1E81|nr:TRAP transporter small permease subunit [Ferrovibrio sp.]
MITARLESGARLLDLVVEQAGRLASWTGFALVLVMAFNVLLRYLFHTGSVAMQELEWHLMAPVSLLCMAYAIKHEGHVRVDILYGRFPPCLKQGLEVVSCLVAVAFAAIIIKLSLGYVMQSYAIGETSPDPGGLPYRFLLKAMIPLGFLLLLIQSLAATLRALIPVFGGPASPESQPDRPLEHAAE